MKKLFNHLWIFYILIHYGQTKIIGNISQDELGMDEAYLTITNANYPNPIEFTYNIVVCEYCNFEKLDNIFSANTSQTIKIDTTYPYDLKIYTATINKTLVCKFDSYSFYEHGSYLFQISQVNSGESSCTIVLTKQSSYYRTPVICAILFLCCLALIIQLCHHMYHSRYIARILTKIGYQRLIANEPDTTSIVIPTQRPPIITNEDNNEDTLGVVNAPIELPSVASPRLSNSSIKITKVVSKRLRSVDTFRGFAIMIMILVNYGGGGYWFFEHSAWNGLTLADLVFPWFVWMMGLSIVLSQQALFKKKTRKISIFYKICQRTIIFFLLGLIVQGGYETPEDIRILGVLQRLALCYFLTAVLVVIFADDEECNSSQWPICYDVHQPIREELKYTIFNFWRQWICILVITAAWVMITFLPKLNDCPRGYIGPGGKHYYGKYQNCTGGVAGYLDRVIIGPSRMFNNATCKEVYETVLPYDPEGLLGVLTGTLVCYIGVQAGHIFVYSTNVRRICIQWIVFGLICGFLGLLLSKGCHSESWIPINKNLWSLSFAFLLSGLAFIILTILYLLVDVYKLFTGEPMLWLGMNSIVLYCGHYICLNSFPIQFKVNQTHPELLALHVYGVTWWIVIAGVLYYKKIFIAI